MDGRERRSAKTGGLTEDRTLGIAPETPAPGGAPTTFSLGQIVDDRYRIFGLLGRGGMGEVWRAFDQKLQVEVALKSLLDARESGERRREPGAPDARACGSAWGTPRRCRRSSESEVRLRGRSESPCCGRLCSTGRVTMPETTTMPEVVTLEERNGITRFELDPKNPPEMSREDMIFECDQEVGGRALAAGSGRADPPQGHRSQS
jgi:serine/threonine protein kinase